MAEFVGLFYGGAILMSLLSTLAGRHDIAFINKINSYKETRPEVGRSCLKSCQRHLSDWYLTPELIPFAICKEGFDTGQRQELVNALIEIPQPA
jgi:hypothetical protein